MSDAYTSQVYDSYLAVAATPAAWLQFLERSIREAKATDQSLQDYWRRGGVLVAGRSFDPVRQSVCMADVPWDLDDLGAADLQAIARAEALVKREAPSYEFLAQLEDRRILPAVAASVASRLVADLSTPTSRTSRPLP